MKVILLEDVKGTGKKGQIFPNLGYSRIRRDYRRGCGALSCRHTHGG